MLDKVVIKVSGGGGGSGAISFRHEKFVPYGGPDGGDGGHGGNVIITSDDGVDSLARFQRERTFKAANGSAGKGKKMHGKAGADLMFTVPPGTVVSRKVDNEYQMLADLEQSGQSVVVARGGGGGNGNVHFASSTHQTPQIAEKGAAGEEAEILLEMRLIADVGIIGYPNVGKSSLLTLASAARPKIASYPFTTLEPVLGVVEAGGQSFVLAEIPGLIEGAFQGKGLGHEFLRHAMRTRMLLHLVDGSSQSPAEDMAKVNNELALFDHSLARKPQIIAVNKIDLPEVEPRLPDIEAAFRGIGVEVGFISASTGRGVPELMARVARALARFPVAGEEAAPTRVFRPSPKREIAVRKEGEVFVVAAPGVDRLVSSEDGMSPSLRWHIKKRLARMGALKQLKKAGIKPGDRVRIGNMEIDW